MTSLDNQLYIANQYARLTLLALDDVLGHLGVAAVLNWVGRPDLINQYPPNTPTREFAYQDYAALGRALESLYGLRGGRGIAQRAGRAAFNRTIESQPEFAVFGTVPFRTLRPDEKMIQGLQVLADALNNMSHQQAAVSDQPDHIIFQVAHCAACSGGQITANQPLGHFLLGMLREGVYWLSGGHEHAIQEEACQATGAPFGRYRINKVPIN